MIDLVRNRVVGWAAVLFLGATAACLAAAFGTRLHLSRSVQPRSGEIRLDILEAPVSIAYDEWAIPRISARSEKDLFRAQGFVHASERLWQLELFQRSAQGRLAELFGEPALEVDRLLRALDLQGATERELAGVDPRSLELLQAYADGVNARVASWRGPLPPEFLVLGIEPQPWSPAASVSIVRLMAMDLTTWTRDLGYLAQLARLDEAHRELMRPWHPASDPVITQIPLDGPLRARGTLGIRMSFAPIRRGAGPTAIGEFDRLGLLTETGLNASNSWALAPERTAGGHALLAGDTHLGLRAPSTWYLNALRVVEPEANELEASATSGERPSALAGLSIPGTPGVVIGMNGHVAWTFTNGGVDDADFVIETVSEDGRSYLEGEEWLEFRERREVIAVRGGSSEEIVVRSTERGPIITDVLPAGGLVLSLAWTGLEPAGPIAAILGMNRARNAEELLAAAEGFFSPHQNLLFATTEGRIGFRLVGGMPARDGGAGALDFAGGGGWSGHVPADSMPYLVDPPSGYLVTANNLQSPDSYGKIAVDYPIPDRARRIDQVVSRAEGWGIQDMAQLQIDTRSLWAERYLHRAVAAARRAGADRLAARLAEWDLTVEPESLGAAPYYAWLYRYRSLLVADELGENGRLPGFAFLRLMEDGREIGGQAVLWADDVATDEVETVALLEELAVQAALPLIDEPWGRVSLERSAHPLGSVPLLDRLLGFNVGPYPARGGPYTVRPVHRASWTALDSTSWIYPRTNGSGPSQRFVARMAPHDPTGYFKLPTGQSGNPLDRHYRDMAAGWALPELIELSPGPWEKEPTSVLRLLPTGF